MNIKSTVTMNIFLHRKQLMLFLLVLIGIPLMGQTDTTIQTQPGEQVDLSFLHYRGLPLGLQTIDEPEHGQLNGPNLVLGNTEFFTYTYQPNEGFIGEDEFQFTRMTCFAPNLCLDTVTVTIQVQYPIVKAHQDVAFAMLNADAQEIDVLANDEGFGAELSILNVPMVNNGTARVENNKIYFQPKTGFEGIASFNYNVCNPYGECDLATVNVVVNGVVPGASDTLRIFTGLNEAIPIITPADYELNVSPANGAFADDGDVPYYTPNPNFLGKDYLTFSYGTFTQTVEVNVLDYRRNSFLVNDRAYVIPSKTVELDVFANDAIDGNPCLESISQPRYGSVYIDPENPGVLTYQAPSGFVGIDEFTYSSFGANCQGELETATVTVYVSNFEPASSKYQMTTPKRTPLVIGYYVPIKDFTMEIKEKPKRGQLLFLEGNVDTILLGRQITGHNMMVYLPSDNIDQGADDFEISYCLSPGSASSRGFINRNSGGCLYQKNVKVEVEVLNIGSGQAPMCFGDCIWSGDTNFDGVVNLEDLLPIGLRMGEIGTERVPRQFNEWYGQESVDWAASEMENTSRHIDTDGDSFISAADTMAIRDFYGRTHSMTSAKIPTYDYKVYLKGTSRLRPGDMMELEVYIGTEQAPAVDLYGFTFNLPYNPRLFKPGTMEIEFLSNSWITYNSPTLDMENNNKAGLLAAAFTRTNQLAISGYGQVAVMRGVVTDIILGGKDEDGLIEIDLDQLMTSTAGTGSGNAYGIEVDPFTLTIDLNDANTPETDEGREIVDDRRAIIDSDLIAFPNPARDQLTFHLNGGQNIQRVQLFDLNGRLISDSGRLNDRRTQLNVAAISDGVYMARVIAEKGVVAKRVKIIH
jgi:hypothetical protein